MDDITGIIFDIARYAIHDGPGIRTTVYFKGCPLNCWWCHNPEGIKKQPQMILRSERCISCGDCVRICPEGAIKMTDGGPQTSQEKCTLCGKCVDICYAEAREIAGEQKTVNDVMKEIQKDLPFYKQSGGGVTFSGGEPLMQSDFLMELLKQCKAKGIHTTVDTTGYMDKMLIMEAAKLTDLFLYDIKFFDSAKHRKYTGVDNSGIKENLKSLLQVNSKIIIRIPVIPGINDDDEEMKNIAKYISSMNGLVGVSLLPYHKLALEKFRRLGWSYKLTDTELPEKAKLESIKNTFKEYNIKLI